jgi:hypothetical protein
LDIRRDDLAPFLGGEDAMIERRTIGMRHTHIILPQGCCRRGREERYSMIIPARRPLPSALTGRRIRLNHDPRVSPWAIVLPSLREAAAI